MISPPLHISALPSAHHISERGRGRPSAVCDTPALPSSSASAAAQYSATAMASALLSAPAFQGLRRLKPTDHPPAARAPPGVVVAVPARRRAGGGGCRAELSAPLVISLSTGLSLFLGRFVFFNFQRENVAKQGLPKQNGVSHYDAGDVRAKEYEGLLKSNDPVGFNIIDVLAWGSIGHIVAYYILATSSNGYDPQFFP